MISISNNNELKVYVPKSKTTKGCEGPSLIMMQANASIRI